MTPGEAVLIPHLLASLAAGLFLFLFLQPLFVVTFGGAPRDQSGLPWWARVISERPIPKVITCPNNNCDEVNWSIGILCQKCSNFLPWKNRKVVFKLMAIWLMRLSLLVAGYLIGFAKYDWPGLFLAVSFSTLILMLLFRQHRVTMIFTIVAIAVIFAAYILSSVYLVLFLVFSLLPIFCNSYISHFCLNGDRERPSRAVGSLSIMFPSAVLSLLFYGGFLRLYLPRYPIILPNYKIDTVPDELFLYAILAFLSTIVAAAVAASLRGPQVIVPPLWRFAWKTPSFQAPRKIPATREGNNLLQIVVKSIQKWVTISLREFEYVSRLLFFYSVRLIAYVMNLVWTNLVRTWEYLKRILNASADIGITTVRFVAIDATTKKYVPSVMVPVASLVILVQLSGYFGNELFSYINFGPNTLSVTLLASALRLLWPPFPIILFLVLTALFLLHTYQSFEDVQLLLDAILNPLAKFIADGFFYFLLSDVGLIILSRFIGGPYQVGLFTVVAVAAFLWLVLWTSIKRERSTEGA